LSSLQSTSSYSSVLKRAKQSQESRFNTAGRELPKPASPNQEDVKRRPGRLLQPGLAEELQAKPLEPDQEMTIN
jgi:hypothetical protein